MLHVKHVTQAQLRTKRNFLYNLPTDMVVVIIEFNPTAHCTPDELQITSHYKSWCENVYLSQLTMVTVFQRIISIRLTH